ncbi:MAG: polysaccharide deacetylase family protein [Gemmobacter sp.]
MNAQAFRDALQAAADAGHPATFWLRDDDATQPSDPLDRLLALTARHAVPVALAAIPAGTGQPLADRLADEGAVTVAVHGWAHRNHAGPDEKKQELGAHRPVSAVLDELARGLGHLRRLHGDRCLPVLVPPWNRIHADVVQDLPGIGYAALSVFGPEKPAPLRVLNTHVDLIDWRGSGRAKSLDVLLAELAACLRLRRPVGLLTHHLVHDGPAWDVLDRVLALASGHAHARWAGLPVLLARVE